MALDEDRVVEVVGRNAGDNAPAVRQPSRPANRPVVPVGAPPPRSAPVRRRPVKRLVLVALLLAAAGYGGQLGYRWWTEGRFMVRTDDAYVQGDITLLAAHAEGYVASVEVINNQEVRAGDVIARLDDGDYRLAPGGGAEPAGHAGERDCPDRPPDRGRSVRCRQGASRAGSSACRRRPCQRRVRAAEQAGPERFYQPVADG